MGKSNQAHRPQRKLLLSHKNPAACPQADALHMLWEYNSHHPLTMLDGADGRSSNTGTLEDSKVRVQMCSNQCCTRREPLVFPTSEPQMYQPFCLQIRCWKTLIFIFILHSSSTLSCTRWDCQSHSSSVSEITPASSSLLGY